MEIVIRHFLKSFLLTVDRFTYPTHKNSLNSHVILALFQAGSAMGFTLMFNVTKLPAVPLEIFQKSYS